MSLPFKDIEDEFYSIYRMVDKYIIKFLSAIVVSSKMDQTDPIWPFIIANSGSMKTELITSLNLVDNVHPVTTFTSKTLISGAKGVNGEETSLLIQIQNGIIAIEDFTVIMSESRDEKSAIFGQLRAVYGGRFDKQFGTGDRVSWEGKLTIIAGTTHEIHRFREQYSQLGERFLNYNLILPPGKEAAKKAGENQIKWKMQDNRTHIQEMVRDYHRGFSLPKTPPSLPQDIKDEMLHLANFATLSRTSVPREIFSPSKDITGTIHPEQPTRFYAQLLVLGQSLACMNINELNSPELLDLDREILRKVAMDSTTDNRRIVLHQLAKHPAVFTSGLAMKLGWPTNTARRFLEDLNALGIVVREKMAGSRGDSWILEEDYRQIIKRYDGIKEKAYDLTEKAADGPPPEQLPKEMVAEIEQAEGLF